MDEYDETAVASVGEQLRVAREEKKLSLEDVAAQTRIPRRHLESVENSDWAALPAPTYTVGFAKSYATAVGLDRVEIGNQLRAEMGGARPAPLTTEVFEAADPARTMPKWLVFGAIAAVILLVVGMSWYNRRSLQDDSAANAPAADTAAAPDASAPPVAPQPVAAAAPAASGPVTLVANAPVWLQIYDKGGKTYFSGELAAGQTYAVPADAKAPLLKTGKPEAIKVNVGATTAPAVGAAATTVRDVSLLGPDLMRGPAAGTVAAKPSVAPPAQAGVVNLMAQ